MVLFIVFIVTLGVLMQRAGSDLVTEDYYLKDRTYQGDINALKNASKHHMPLQVLCLEKEIVSLQVPDSLLPISVHFYFMRPNNKNLDQETDINFETDSQINIAKGFLLKGHYQVSARYVIDSDSCMQEFYLNVK